MKTEDLVTELRAWGTNGYMMQAADEIERLNACVAEANAYMAEAALAIERLRAERDEARRLYCIAFQEITENLGEKNTTESIAKEMGWDCFKENS